jgi:hypothetical protein
MAEYESTEPCPHCSSAGERVFTPPGMIKVRDGASPTRVGNRYSTTPRSQDVGFDREFESIYESDPIHDPNTGERYVMTEDPDTGQRKGMTKTEEMKQDADKGMQGAIQRKDREEFIERQVDYAKAGLTKEFLAKHKDQDWGTQAEREKTFQEFNVDAPRAETD